MTHEIFITYILIPVLIFLARVADVSIGTMRIIFVSKGYKYIAPILGFFEILIWLMAMSRIFQNLDMWFYYIAYAAGFATGNLVGLMIEERLALGYVNLRIITHHSGAALIQSLRKEGYGVTTVNAQGSQGPVNIIYCVIKRVEIKVVNQIIAKVHPTAFFTIEDVRTANKDVFPLRSQSKSVQSAWRLGK